MGIGEGAGDDHGPICKGRKRDDESVRVIPDLLDELAGFG
jgi:hypothetical protein